MEGVDMNDQRVVRRPAFDPEDFSDRAGIEDIGAQTIHRFSGKCDKLSVTEKTRGTADIPVADIP